MLAGHDAAYIKLVWIVASLVGVSVLSALAVAYRRAARRAELEHAERVIAEHDQLFAEHDQLSSAGASGGASGGEAPNCT